MKEENFKKNLQYYKFCFYGFFKNLRFFEAFLILFFLENGLNFLEIGILYSIREIVIVLMEIPSGLIADTLGRRKTLVASFLVYAISFLGFSFSNNFVLFASSMTIFAIADAFRSGVHKAMIFQYLKVHSWEKQKVSYYGHTRSWSQAGTAISAAVAALIVFISGSFQIIFIAATIPYLIDALLIWSYPKYLDGEKTKMNFAQIKKKFKKVIKAFADSFKSLSIFRPLANLSLYTGFYKSVKDYIQPLIKIMALSVPVFASMNDEKKTAVLVGTFYFLSYLLTSLASKYSGNFNKLFSKASKPMNFTIIAGFATGVIVGLFFEYGFYVISVIGFVILIIIENLRKPIGIALVAEQTDDNAMASVLSAESQAKSIFAAIIAPILGLLADTFSPGISILMVSFVLLAAFGIYKIK
jgi:MFS family permease